EWRDAEMSEYRVSIPKDNKNPTPQQIADAIIATGGMIMQAAIKMKISYGKMHKIIKKNPKLQSIITDVTESMLDLAENKLRDAILAGDRACIIFFLKCKGRFRGWREDVDLPDMDQPPVTFAYDLVLPAGAKIVGEDGSTLYERKKAEGEN
ncbi:MAG TPA: hypothetical protein VJL87_05520, partial [Bdellovibrionota bacterium]|nr:hypothetical protein [Bdellovibrionota bacterium]